MSMVSNTCSIIKYQTGERDELAGEPMRRDDKFPSGEPAAGTTRSVDEARALAPRARRSFALFGVPG
jgi:hypothetical protein